MFLAMVVMGCSKSVSEPKVSRGSLTNYNEFPSQYISSRTVRVWTPDGYPDAAPYDVLYMHDGQMLYDAAFAWNKQEWGIDEVVQMLLALVYALALWLVLIIVLTELRSIVLMMWRFICPRAKRSMGKASPWEIATYRSLWRNSSHLLTQRTL